MQITTMLHLTQVAAMNFASHKQHFTMILNALHRIEPTKRMRTFDEEFQNDIASGKTIELSFGEYFS